MEVVFPPFYLLQLRLHQQRVFWIYYLILIWDYFFLGSLDLGECSTLSSSFPFDFLDPPLVVSSVLDSLSLVVSLVLEESLSLVLSLVLEESLSLVISLFFLVETSSLTDWGAFFLDLLVVSPDSSSLFFFFRRGFVCFRGRQRLFSFGT